MSSLLTLSVSCRATGLLRWENLAAKRKWGNVSFATSPLSSPCLNISLPVFPFCDRPTLEPQSVFLCSEVGVLLVPFAWGQALFSVKVLRVYPNVQDLGVSARLSESGGTEEKRHAGQDSCRNLWQSLKRSYKYLVRYSMKCMNMSSKQWDCCQMLNVAIK